MRRTSILFSLVLAACDGSPEIRDAGSDAFVPIDAGRDAGPPFDPHATFVSSPPQGEGPWGLWGFSVAAVDEDTAYVVGGTNSSEFGAGEVFASVWRVEIGSGSVTATEIEVDGPSPPPRYCGCATYDPVRERIVMYGGRDLETPLIIGQTWELDLAGPTWTRIETANVPTGTLGCSMVWEPSEAAIYLFGGASRLSHSDEVHRYDPAAPNWDLVEIEDRPLGRYDAALFQSREGDSLYMFGGSYGATGAAFYADLWRFDPSEETWTEIVLPDGPPGRRTPWVVRDPERNGLYIGFGYDGRMLPYGDLWYLDLETRTWTEITIADDGPYFRGFSPSLPGGADSFGTMIGGYGDGIPTLDAWQLRR
jgi:hypothetical protein